DADKVTNIAVSVEVTNKMLNDLPHGFYKDDPAGIWQPVSLLVTDPVRIQDVFIQPGLTGAKFDITVKNDRSKQAPFLIGITIRDKSTGQVLTRFHSLANRILKPGEEKTFNYTIEGLKPKLWTPQSPNLYDFTFELLSGDQPLDATTITSGF